MIILFIFVIEKKIFLARLCLYYQLNYLKFHALPSCQRHAVDLTTIMIELPNTLPIQFLSVILMNHRQIAFFLVVLRAGTSFDASWNFPIFPN